MLNLSILTDQDHRTLSEAFPSIDPSVTLPEIWSLMDAAWVRYGCHLTPLTNDKLSAFYADPVWLLYGLFAESDYETVVHRRKFV